MVTTPALNLQSRQWELIQQQYTIPEPDEVLAFLQENPEPLAVLLEARPYLDTIFGANTEVELRVVADYEVPDWIELFAYVWTGLSVEEAAEKMHRFDQTWFLSQMERADCKLTYSLRFR